ncbi:hypothetical protein CTAM01_01761 [Colletotrichum tamarilloi]|uniref:C2H2-type domain-containing protein n=1 Tax=Colletotrichum tamarilloi TaxID=1209934 RepID=A0ABQ9RPH3_9PEZI|nr:uncharacterized protein CTAM01_01761 [Colletotrichum tamarilloi]KAK1509638.1 hypothetical protein CTAM01_01761 [Colletotrichum tamarilloi]
MPTEKKTPKISLLECGHPDCGGRKFSDQSNFNRHQKSVHGDEVLMYCGNSIRDRSDNIKRHQKNCGVCKQTLGTPQIAVGNESGPEITSNVNIQGAEPQYAGVPQNSYQQLWMQPFQEGQQHGYRDGWQTGWQYGQDAYQSGYTYAYQYLQQSQQQTTQPLDGLQQNYQGGYQTGYQLGYPEGYYNGYYQSH